MPVYNEEEVLMEVVKKVRKYFTNVICVDDGSTDGSQAVIKKSGVTLIKHPINLGAGAATQTGIEYGLQNKHAGYFITFDADGQHDIKDAVNILKHLKDNELDIVFGSRFMGSTNVGRLKKIFLKSAATFSARTTGIKLTDPHVGLRAFNRKFAENLKLTLPDFTHASELIYRIAEGDYKYTEAPITVAYTKYSKSKGQPMLNSINIAIDLFFHRMSKK
jgi:glycosyltransferase involved in cell wall biosynthesis